MPTFTLTVYDPNTRSTSQQTRSGKEPEVREAVEKKGLTVLAIQETTETSSEPTRLFAGKEGTRPLKRTELVIFCRSMALMVRAGNSVSEAMSFYAKSIKGPLGGRFMDMARKLAGGDSFYNVFSKSGLFDSICCGVISAGEKGGNLAVSFKMLGDRYARLQFFISKTRRAISIPVGITVFMGALFIASQFLIVPMVEKMLHDSHIEPDMFSAYVFKMANIVRHTWFIGVGGIIAFGFMIIFSIPFRNTIVYFLMNTFTSFRKVVMGMRQATFLSTVRVLYGNGVDLLESLGTAAQALQKTPMGAELKRAAADYRSGMALSEALRRNTSCDEKLIHMVRMAEDKDLVAQLENIEEMYNDETVDYMDRLSQTVNLLSYAFASILIGIVFIGSYLPITMMAARMMTGGG
ncbi:MAG: type II secretion system F family protein [Verrucomicrobium sp.]|nr:type II secretion system F family protein [Verrucomicrobium sp.]